METGYQNISIEEIKQEDLAKLVMDMFHRIIVHHVLWFREVEHQLGLKKALDVLDQVYPWTSQRQLTRLSKELGFEIQDGLPNHLLNMPKKDLVKLMTAVGKNWLANDGIWFLSVENKHGMNEAKRCNDSSWARFSPFEAWSIKRLFQLPEFAGIEGLKMALGFRMYARVNVQTIIEEGPDCIQFQMNDCRVQSARKQKGLDDYPCKSGGLVEYKYFAETIDKRIKTECLGCPPDPHPEEWYCAWRFSIAQGD